MDIDDFQMDFCNELKMALGSTEIEEGAHTPHSPDSETESVDTDINHQTLDQIPTLIGTLKVLQERVDHISGNLQGSVDEFELSVAHLRNPQKRVASVRMCHLKVHRQHVIHLLDDMALQWMNEMDSTKAFEDGCIIDSQAAHDVIQQYMESNDGKFPEWIGALQVNGDLSLRCMPNPTGNARSLPESFGCIVVNGSIDVSNNQINDLPFHLSDLYIEHTLDLSNNELSTFLLSNDLYIPGNLDLSNNKFKYLPDEFSKYAVILGDLILSNNRELQVSIELLGVVVQGKVVAEGLLVHNQDSMNLVSLVITDDITFKSAVLKEMV